MCGTDETNFNKTQALSTSLTKNSKSPVPLSNPSLTISPVVAVVEMGDPSHVPGLSSDVGNSTKAGVFPRMNTASCNASAPITKSYCNADDRFCDSGNSLPVHLSYVQVYGNQAAAFVVQEVEGKSKNATSSKGGEMSGAGKGNGTSTTNTTRTE